MAKWYVPRLYLWLFMVIYTFNTSYSAYTCILITMMTIENINRIILMSSVWN